MTTTLELDIPQNLVAGPGTSINVPIDVNMPAGESLTSSNALSGITLDLLFDPSVLTANSVALTAPTSGWSDPSQSTTIDNTNGTIFTETDTLSGLSGNVNEAVLTINFTVNPSAAIGSTTPINIALNADGGHTILTDAQGDQLTLSPAPTNANNDPVDGILTVQGIVPTPQTVTAIEGAPFTGEVASFTDPNASSTQLTASISWGDNATTTGTVTTAVGGGFVVNGSHTYAEEGTQSVIVTITDHSSGQVATVTSTAQITDPAVIATPRTLTATEGASGSLSVATFTDPGGAEAVSDYAATIAWGDGTTTTGASITLNSGVFTVSGTHAYSEEGTESPVVTISHDSAPSVTTTASITVSDVAVVATPATLAAVEGASGNFNIATFTDPGGAEALTDYGASIVWGDGTTTTGASISFNAGVFTVSGTHTYAEEGSKSPVVTITHDTAPPTAVTASINVSDPSVIATPATLTAVEGESGSFNVATFTDPGGAEAIGDYSATINWGDGVTTNNASISVNSGVFTVNGTHTYAEEGTKAPVVTISHDSALPVTSTATITVSDPAVVATPRTLTATEGASSLLSVATFTDPGGAEAVSDYAATIAWGDGTTTTGASITLNSGVFTVSGTHAYSEEGTESPVVTISHDSPPSVTTTASITVSDVAVVATPATLAAVEGASGNFNIATFTDPGGAEALTDYVASIVWGDGTTTTGASISFNAGVFTVSGTHTYAEEGSKSPVVTITHDTAPPTTVTASINVSDPSVIATPATLTAVEGASGSFNVATFTDPGGAEAIGDYSATINWDDGVTTNNASISVNSGVFTVNGTHTYAEEGTKAPVVTISHDSALPVTSTATITVSDPSVDITPATVTVGKGVTASLSIATFTDPGGAESVGDYAATIAWGDGTTTAGASITLNSGVFTVSGTHTYAGAGTESAVVTVNHESAAPASKTATVEVVNEQIFATGVSSSATEGSTFSGQVATFTDTNAALTSSDFTASINWGDGSSSVGTVSAQTGGGFAVSGSHLYAEEGTQSVTVTIAGINGISASANSKAGVADALITGTAMAIFTSATMGTIATFTDENPAATSSDFTALINWGDGTSSGGAVVPAAGGKFAVTAAHTYITPATQPVVVTVTDAGGSVFIGVSSSNLQVAGPNAGAVLYAATDTALSSVAAANFTYGTGSTPVTAFHATIDWGDGSTSPGSVTETNGAYSVAGTHTYAVVGDYATATTVVVGNTQIVLEGHALTGAPHEQYVMAVYQDVLGRAPDSGGLVYWSQQLDQAAAQGTAAFENVRGAVAQSIAHSAEYYANVIVTSDYERFLNRLPDAGGLVYWVDQMQNQGVTDQQLEEFFITSDEFYQNSANENTYSVTEPADEDCVHAVYEQLLGRSADTAGFQYWLAALQNAESTESAEQARQDAAQGIAGSTENNTNLVEQIYFHYLGRAADPNGLVYWLQQFGGGATIEDIISGFTGSDEYYDKHTGISPE